jgi:hypothetical protein
MSFQRQTNECEYTKTSGLQLVVRDARFSCASVQVGGPHGIACSSTSTQCVDKLFPSLGLGPGVGILGQMMNKGFFLF